MQQAMDIASIQEQFSQIHNRYNVGEVFSVEDEAFIREYASPVVQTQVTTTIIIEKI